MTYDASKRRPSHDDHGAQVVVVNNDRHAGRTGTLVGPDVGRNHHLYYRVRLAATATRAEVEVRMRRDSLLVTA